MASLVGPIVRPIVRPLVTPIQVGARRLPPLGLIVLAAIGAAFLAVILTTSWPNFNDEHAYWLAATRLASGEALYDPLVAANTPFAYWYPPPLAQVLAPLTGVMTAEAFSLTWTILLLACLWWLAGRDPLVALALIAFLPVAVELRVRNVHLLLAVLAVLALRRSWAFWIPAAALKLTPVLGGVYLAAAGRWREVAALAIAGVAVLGVSVVVSPVAWEGFLEVAASRSGTDGGSLLPIPFAVRLAAGAILAAIGGRVGGVRGESLLVVGLTIANPTLWATAFSILVALLPLWRSPAAAPAPTRVARPQMSAA